ncbi:glycosyltransferase family 4 protein [Alsobacter sp. KACC 23698]|uniref:Glycosyltransferase family 4 protein n=1 Tax=Alsobacter sp. KACC 23698 TaxID=3149229 RepID=A0AAU7JJE1_9HYPH
MRVGIATVHTPGIHGGAEYLVDGLVEATHRAGHSIHKISLPFQFDPPAAAGVALGHCETVDFTSYGGGALDALICLKFPTYVMRHPGKRVWLLHQHRPAYDLYGTAYGWRMGEAQTDALRARIQQADRDALGGATPVFTIAKRVSERLMSSHGIASEVLYHPPANAPEFRCDPALPYIFAPSRLETLKRQHLLVEALSLSRGLSGMGAVFAGAGSLRPQLEALAEKLGVSERVRFVGAVSRAEMLALYSRCAAVFFGPLDEDYGYVTLEAMLSAKPVVTCADSGGPLEFVKDGETGFVVEPSPAAIADGFARLLAPPRTAAELGRQGRAHYDALGVGWDPVIERLLAGVGPRRAIPAEARGEAP